MTIPYVLPEGEAASKDYKITLSGKDVQAQVCRVSACPYNTVWPGFQRPIDQTELAAFLSFDITRDGAKNTVEVEPMWDWDECVIRPLSKHVTFAREGNKIRFDIPSAGQYTVETDGEHRALHIFANDAVGYAVAEGDPNTLYFGPGVHDAGGIVLRDGETVYIDKEAVVYGYLLGEGVTNVRVIGNGVLDNSRERRQDKRANASCLRLTRCRNVLVEGIVFRDACVWTATVSASENVVFDNVKLIGMWRYNSDGIDLCNCRNCVIRNSFLRNFDDCVVLKGLPPYEKENVENILVANCVIWCDWGRALEIGAETCAPAYRNIRFADCDIIHNAHIAMDIQSSGNAEVSRVLFENIRVEYSRHTRAPVYQHDMDAPFPDQGDTFLPHLMFAETHTFYLSRLLPGAPLGHNRDIEFTDIDVTCDPGLGVPPSLFKGMSETSDTKGVRIRNLTVNGKRMETLADANVTVGDYASDVTIE